MIIKLHTPAPPVEVYTHIPDEWPDGLYTRTDTGEVITVQGPAHGNLGKLCLLWKVNSSMPVRAYHTSYNWIKVPTGTRFEYGGIFTAP